MKKILLLSVALLVLSGCKKTPVDDGRTSYTFVNKVLPLEALNINCWIYEYNRADQRIDSNYIATPEYNKDYTFYPSDSCHHIKAKVFSTEKDRWSPDVFLIKPGKNIRIEVSLQTEYAFKEPEYHE
ncbi:MAG: hypothetical protein MJZ51_00485 [Bacteroidales bacterium]|nr:hypothetical protein [Bacteroidales bacterium]